MRDRDHKDTRLIVSEHNLKGEFRNAATAVPSVDWREATGVVFYRLDSDINSDEKVLGSRRTPFSVPVGRFIKLRSRFRMKINLHRGCHVSRTIGRGSQTSFP